MSRRGRLGQEGRKRGDPAVRGASWFFVVDVARPGQPRKQIRRRGFPTQKAAQEALAEPVGNVRAGRPATTSRMPLGDYLTAWLEGLPAAGRKATTVASYGKMLRRYVLDTDLATIPLGDLTAVELDALYAVLAKRVSLRSVRYVHSIVGKALADAERKDLISRNPARLASAPATSATRAPEMSVWTPAELNRFLGDVGAHHGALCAWRA